MSAWGNDKREEWALGTQWAASLNGQHSKKQDTKGRLATGKWGSTVHCTVGLGAPLSKRGETRGEVTTGEGGGEGSWL